MSLIDIHDSTEPNKRVLSKNRSPQTNSATASQSSRTTGSKFSVAELIIDLAKLAKKGSGSTMAEAETEIDIMGSENDGPPDFTLNLEKWMRGTEKWQKEAQEDDEKGKNFDSHERDGEEEQQSESDDLQADEKIEDVSVDESEFLPLSTSTPAPLASQKTQKSDSRAADNLYPQPPSLPRLNTELRQNRATEEVFDQISALQAEVEKLRLAEEDSSSINAKLKRENAKLRNELESITYELQTVNDTLSKLQEEAKAAEKSREMERKSRDDAKSKVASLRTKFEPLVQELAIARSTAEAEKRCSDLKIATLEAKLLTLQEDNVRQQNEQNSVQMAKVAEIQQMKSQLDICRGEIKAYQETLKSREGDHTLAMMNLNRKVEASHDSQSSAAALKKELEHAHEQLAETRRIVDTVEEENDRLANENERQLKEKSEMSALNASKDASIFAARSLIETLKDEISRVQGEKKAGVIEEETHMAELDQLRQQHEASMLEAKKSHDQQIKSLKSTILRAGDGMRKREARLEKSHRQEIVTLSQEITALKLRLNAPSDASQAKSTELRAVIRQLCTRLAAANDTITSTRQELKAAQKSLAAALNDKEALRQEHDAVDAEMDKRADRREAEWRKKTQELLDERKRMQKMLMRAWGAVEFGEAKPGEKQKYRYMYYWRDGTPKAPEVIEREAKAREAKALGKEMGRAMEEARHLEKARVTEKTEGKV